MIELSHYGYCPICYGPGVSREKRPDGNDICSNKHKYPSRTAIPLEEVERLRGVKPVPSKRRNAIPAEERDQDRAAAFLDANLQGVTLPAHVYDTLAVEFAKQRYETEQQMKSVPAVSAWEEGRVEGWGVGRVHALNDVSEALRKDKGLTTPHSANALKCAQEVVRQLFLVSVPREEVDARLAPVVRPLPYEELSFVLDPSTIPVPAPERVWIAPTGLRDTGKVTGAGWELIWEGDASFPPCMGPYYLPQPGYNDGSRAIRAFDKHNELNRAHGNIALKGEFIRYLEAEFAWVRVSTIEGVRKWLQSSEVAALIGSIGAKAVANVLTPQSTSSVPQEVPEAYEVAKKKKDALDMLTTYIPLLQSLARAIESIKEKP